MVDEVGKELADVCHVAIRYVPPCASLPARLAAWRVVW